MKSFYIVEWKGFGCGVDFKSWHIGLGIIWLGEGVWHLTLAIGPFFFEYFKEPKERKRKEEPNAN